MSAPYYLLLAGGALWSFSAFSRPPLPLQIPYSGAGAASLKDDFSFQINPAILGLQQKPSLLAAYSRSGAEQRGILAGQDQKGGIPLGISFERLWREKGSAEDRWSVSAGRRINRHLSLGASVIRDHLKPHWSADAGLLFKSGTETALGLTLSRIGPSGRRGKTLTLGVYRGFGKLFSIRADGFRDFQEKKWIFKGGLDTLFFDFLSLKAGGLYDKKEKAVRLSGGLAFLSQGLQIEYGAQQEGKLLRHAFSVRLVF